MRYAHTCGNGTLVFSNWSPSLFHTGHYRNPLNKYIRHYEGLSYDTELVHSNHQRAKRALSHEDKFLHLDFHAHGRFVVFFLLPHINLKGNSVWISVYFYASSSLSLFTCLLTCKAHPICLCCLWLKVDVSYRRDLQCHRKLFTFNPVLWTRRPGQGPHTGSVARTDFESQPRFFLYSFYGLHSSENN